MSTLTYETVKRRVEKVSDGVVDELYAFGQILVADAVDRIAKSDSKAAALAVYGGGVITVLISTSVLWGKLLHGAFLVVAVLAILVLMVAAWLAISSISPKRTDWYSDEDWLREECLDERGKLRRYRVLTMWRIITSLDEAYGAKLKKVHWSTRVMKFAFVLLLLAFLQVALRHAALHLLRFGIR